MNAWRYGMLGFAALSGFFAPDPAAAVVGFWLVSPLWSIACVVIEIVRVERG